MNTPFSEAYWRRHIEQWLTEKGFPFQPFYNHHTINGQKLYDANPIFDGYFPSRHKLVRIIQFYPEAGDLPITGWIDYWPTDQMDDDQKPTPADPGKRDQAIPELVISLALTPATKSKARHLLTKWIIEDLAEEEMKKEIKNLKK